MKKTLFLAAMLACAVAPVSADLPAGCTSPDETRIIVNTGNRTISVGSYLGDAEMTVEGNVTLPMQLFIGGKGYGQPVTTGGSGTVTIAAGKTLDVTGQVGVGNTKITGATGTLILEDNATLIADQIVVGSQNGHGQVIVGSGATMTTTRPGSNPSSGSYEKTIIIGGAMVDEAGNSVVSSGNCSGSVIVEEGGSLESNAGIFVGSYGSGSGTLEVKSENVDLTKVTIGGDSPAKGTVIVDVASSSSGSSGAASMQDVTVADGGTLLVKKGTLDVSSQSSGTSGTIEVKQGGTVLVENTSSNQAASLGATNVAVDGGSVKVSGTGAGLDADTFVLNNGATAELADSAVVTVSNQMSSSSDSSVVFSYKDVKDTTAQTGTIVFANQAAAEASQVQGGSAVVNFTGADADDLSAGDRFKLTGVNESSTSTSVGFAGYYWDAGGELREMRDTEQLQGESGTVLELGQSDVNNIVTALSRETTASSINSLNGALTTMTAFANMVKGQIDAPHSVNLPVGNIASDSKLAYTGRYLVGANRVWLSGYGQSDRRATDGKGMGYHYEGGGYAVGYDRIVTPNMYIGAALGHALGKYKANDGLLRDHQNGVNLSLYGRYTHHMKKSDNSLNVDVYLGYGNTRNRARGSFFAGGDDVTGRWNDTSLAGGVTISYDIILSDSSILSPFIGIDATYAMQDDFCMSNASGSSRIDYSDGSASLVTMPVGVTYRYVSAISNTEYLIPFFRVAYLADLNRTDPHADYVRGNAQKARAYGATPARSGVELGVGLNWILNSQWMTGAGYTLQERSGDCDQRVNAFVSYSF